MKLEESKEAFELRNNLHQEGFFSPWFILISVLLMIPDFTYTLTRLSFLHKGPPFTVRCNITDLQDVSWTIEEIQNITQPELHNGNCSCYDYDYKKLSEESYYTAKKIVNQVKNPKVKNCVNVIYDRETGYATIYKEFILFCCNFMEDLLIICPVLGSILGYLFIVPLADVYGRKAMLNFGLNTLTITILMMDLMSSTHMFLFARFFSGIGYAVTKAVTEALIVELSAPSNRTYRYCIVVAGSPGIAFLIMPFLSHCIKDWRYLQWICSVGLLFFPLVKWYVPESPHWLYSKSYKGNAVKIARAMKSPEISNDIHLELFADSGNFWLPIFKHLQQCKGFACKRFWFTTVMIAFIGALYAKNFAEKYETLFLEGKSELLYYFRGASEFISLFFSLSFSQIIGRKVSIILIQFCAVITCFLLTQFRDSWERIILYYTLEITTCTAFTLSKLHGIENSPSSHRCTVLGVFGSSYTMATVILFIIYVNINVCLYFLILGIISTAVLGLVWFSYKDNSDEIFTTYKDLLCE